MKTIPEIKKEIKQIKIDCLKSVQCHFPEFKNDDADGREELYNFKLSDNWHYYLEKKAQLKTSQDIYDFIKNRINNEEENNEEGKLAVINELEFILETLNGEKENKNNDK